jgi:hypothetical protein
LIIPQNRVSREIGLLVLLWFGASLLLGALAALTHGGRRPQRRGAAFVDLSTATPEGAFVALVLRMARICSVWTLRAPAVPLRFVGGNLCGT